MKKKVLLGLAGVISLLLVVGTGVHFLNERLPKEKGSHAFRLGAAMGQVYRHKVHYADICRKLGYEMQVYPQKFMERFQNEIAVIEADQLAFEQGQYDKGVSQTYFADVEAMYQSFAAENQDEVERDILGFFDYLRHRLIMARVAYEQNIAEQDIVWKDEYDSLVTLADVCHFLDESAEALVEKDESFPYILDYVRTRESD